MLLSELQLKQKAVVKGFKEQSSLNDRLMELGVVPGTEILLKRYAPFGDPMEVAIRGYSLSIRKKDAEKILIELGA